MSRIFEAGGLILVFITWCAVNLRNPNVFKPQPDINYCKTSAKILHILPQNYSNEALSILPEIGLDNLVLEENPDTNTQSAINTIHLFMYNKELALNFQ